MRLTSSFQRLVIILSLILFILIIAIAYHVKDSPFFLWLEGGGRAFLRNVYDQIFAHHLLNLGFWIVLSLTFLIQIIIPAAPEQPLLSKGLYQDLIWFIYRPFFSVFIFGTYILWFKSFYTEHLGFLTITAFLDQPGWLRFLIAILLRDFLNWIQHLLLHKVPWLWNLHSIHHSQPQLNFFSAYRFHALEFIVQQTFMVIPFFLLELSAPTIVTYSFFEQWHSKFYHSNIRANFGPLKYIFVTPQSHRIHHSYEYKHINKNFGAIFSFWDYLLKTQYRSYDEYPKTGISDRSFPVETSTSLRSLLIMPFIQMFYAIKKIIILCFTTKVQKIDNLS